LASIGGVGLQNGGGLRKSQNVYDLKPDLVVPLCLIRLRN
jgi:hypothetical protein